MVRKNPNPSSLPNSPVDLTSLLDVIFILLFFVILGYAVAKNSANKKAQTAIDDYNDLKEKYTASKEELAKLNEVVPNLTLENKTLKDINSHLEEVNDAYNEGVIGNRVKIVVISCFYDKDDLKKRVIMTDTPDEEYEEIRFEGNNGDDSVKNAFNLLRVNLSKYIEKSQKDDGSDKQEKTIIVLSLKDDSGQILTRDFREISRIIGDLEDEYEDVY